MNRIETNGSKAVSLIEGAGENEMAQGGPPAKEQSEKAKQPYVPENNKHKPSLKDHGAVLAIGACVVALLLYVALRGIPRRALLPLKGAATHSPAAAKSPDQEAAPAMSILPLLDSGRRPEESTDQSRLSPAAIDRTANKSKPSPGTNLAGVRPFPKAPETFGADWPEPPSAPPAQSQAPSTPTAEPRNERDVLDKASLVFVSSNTAPAAPPRLQENSPAMDVGFGLAPGTRLRARLESAVSTAVQTPVIAVIEYNYEQNGEIVIPAGAKALGRLEAADRSGYIAVHFDVLTLPDGSSIRMEAVATDLELRPIKGKVEGKHTGKNILVRSLAGVGEIAATLAGRNSLNQPLSEGDLLREKTSSNIAQASDQEIAKLAITEHLVVSVPADTEIYVVLQKPAKPGLSSHRGQLPALPQTTNQAGIEELRQLLQLQRELNQAAAPKPSPE